MPASRVVHRRERYHPTSSTFTVGARHVAKSHGEATLDRQMNRSSQACVDWEGVAGAPLTRVLEALGNLDGDAALEFFSSVGSR